jgi:Holliday junction resolvase
MKEQTLQTKIIKLINSKGYCVKVISASHSGIPDIIACIKGKYMAVECKSDIGEMSLLQKYNSEKILKNGGLFFCVNPKNFKEFKIFIDKL